MGKRKEREDKLELEFFKRLDPFFEIPIFIGNEMSRYTITITGEVWSYTGYSSDKPYKLTPVVASNGYYKVTLTHNGVQKIFSIHRLVASAFLPNYDNLPEVNHKDGDKSHNWVWNLEWCTPKENVRHAYRTGLHSGMQGDKHPMSRITEETAVRICELLMTGKYSYNTIADMTGATYTIVKKIKNGVRWTHVSKNYDFSNYKRKNAKLVEN